MPHAITRSALAAMLDAAARAAPREACGLLLGAGTRIHTAQPADNVHPDPLTRFEIDPAALLGAHRSARTGGPEILGYYHSHPAGHPVPSATDCEHASGDGRVWAIIADGEIRLWRDAGGRFEALSYVAVEG